MNQQEDIDNIGTIKVIKRPELSSFLIDDKVHLNKEFYDWKVNVLPGTYYFLINDNFSADFNVYDPNTSTTPNPATTTTDGGGSSVTDNYADSSTPSATSAGIIPSNSPFPPTTSSSGHLLSSYRIYGFIVTIVLMLLL